MAQIRMLIHHGYSIHQKSDILKKLENIPDTKVSFEKTDGKIFDETLVLDIPEQYNTPEIAFQLGVLVGRAEMVDYLK